MTLECDFCHCECGTFENGESCSTDCYVQTPENWDKKCLHSHCQNTGNQTKDIQKFNTNGKNYATP